MLPRRSLFTRPLTALLMSVPVLCSWCCRPGSGGAVARRASGSFGIATRGSTGGVNHTRGADCHQFSCCEHRHCCSFRTCGYRCDCCRWHQWQEKTNQRQIGTARPSAIVAKLSDGYVVPSHVKTIELGSRCSPHACALCALLQISKSGVMPWTPCFLLLLVLTLHPQHQ